MGSQQLLGYSRDDSAVSILYEFIVLTYLNILLRPLKLFFTCLTLKKLNKIPLRETITLSTTYNNIFNSSIYYYFALTSKQSYHDSKLQKETCSGRDIGFLHGIVISDGSDRVTISMPEALVIPISFNLFSVQPISGEEYCGNVPINHLVPSTFTLDLLNFILKKHST